MAKSGLVLWSAVSLALIAAGCDGSFDPASPESAGSVERSTAALVAPGTVLLDADFDSDADGFTYQDDTFRGTSQPAYASGTRVSSGGFSGGALRVRLGNVDEADILGMSGGWRRTFTLSEPAKVTLTFRYNLIQTPHYEADELSQVNGSLDGAPLGAVPGADNFVTIAGDGEGGPPREVGWHFQTNDLGVLPSGTHTLVLGGFNNKKTASIESSDAFIDDVKLVADPPPGAQTVFHATFDSNADGFTYSDDGFRGTNNPTYATGAFSASGGFAGGGLTVTLGGVNDADILGMSGGWARSFTLPAAAQVSLTFRYNLIQSPDYEADEFSEINASLDGAMFGQLPGTDHFVSIAGDGEGGPPRAVGWHNPTVDLGILSAGTHTLRFGGFNNKKTSASESTQAFIDDVLVTASF